MVPYRTLAYRPVRVPYSTSPGQQLGEIRDMNLDDWLLIIGGGIVGGVGVNMVISGITPRPNAVPIFLGAVLSAVGLTVFVDRFRKLIA